MASGCMTIAIIGGGASGVVTAIQLLQTPHAQLAIHLIEPHTLGAGIAYSTQATEHRLNVVAAKMSVYPEQPNHFLDWVRGVIPDCEPETFVPRGVYLTYLQATLQAAIAADLHGRLTVHQTRVAHLETATTHATLTLENGQTLIADRVVLALGNQQPNALTNDPAAVDAGYIGSPWEPHALDQIAPDDPILLVGAGLTAVDLLLTLQQRDHRGRLVVVSRHGRFPLPHAPKDCPVCPDFVLPQTALETVRLVRQKVTEAAAQGIPWQAVLDALRPSLNQWWAQLPHRERCQLIRHVMPAWNITRHRIPMESAAVVDALIASGQLTLIAGRLNQLTVTNVNNVNNAAKPMLTAHFETETGAYTLTSPWVINCTGPSANLRRAKSPLLQQLFADGIINTDSLNLGLAVTPDGAIIDAANRVSPVLCAIGPLCRGVLIESTAVPDIRQQAAVLVERFTTEAATHARSKVNF